jgi:hypothetical protein
MRDSWWCVSSAGSSGAKPPDVVAIPGDGAADVPTVFASDDPNPFPKGVAAAGTLLVFEFASGAPKGAVLKLSDAEGRDVPTIVIDGKSFCFAAKEPLAAKTRYSARLEGADGFKLELSFTTE